MDCRPLGDSPGLLSAQQKLADIPRPGQCVLSYNYQTHTGQLLTRAPDACQPAISKIDILVTVVLNVLTDIYLMSIPIPMLWSSSLRPFKKAGLILLFSGGAFVTVAGVLRCVLIITVSTTIIPRHIRVRGGGAPAPS